MKTEAEMGVTRPQAKNPWGLWEPPAPGRGLKQILLHGLRRNQPRPHLTLDVSLLNQDNNSYSLSHPM